MIFLILSIISSTAIFVLFKLFSKYTINTLHAIIINYITACLCGIIAQTQAIALSAVIKAPWFLAALVLGILFISIFNVMALTAQKNGLSVASVASKMSVVIPIVFGIMVYNESIVLKKIIGILLALLAVYLTTVKPKKNNYNTRAFYLPLLLFIGSGTIDTCVNHFAPQGQMPLFLAVIFACAGFLGLLSLSLKKINDGNTVFNIRAIPFGIALGLVNYSSMYFLLKALRVENFETSSVFTINNVAIVALSCLLGLLIFNERISIKNWVGIGLALVAIVLISL